jgi:predicted permease
MDSWFVIEGQLATPEAFNANPMANWESATPGYFRSMGIPLLRGRTFSETDTSTSPSVVIVSEVMAARMWPGEDAIGKRLRLQGSQEEMAGGDGWSTVVGVVPTARYRQIETPRFDLYVPHRQTDSSVRHYMVRSPSDPVALVPALRVAVASVDPRLSLGGVTSMETIVRRTRGPWHFNMLVFSLFGGVALALAAMGLFGLVAYAVAQRTREIGVRMALGATRTNVVRLMIVQGARPAAIGLAAGLVVAYFSTRVLSGLLFETSPTDPATFIRMAVMLVFVTIAACAWPARRAASVDPIEVLRQE